MCRNTKESININNVIGNRIYNVRLSRGLSRAKLAKEVNITHQQIAKYENGSNKVSAARLYLIAKALDMPINSFYDNIDQHTPLDEVSTQHQRLCLDLSTNFMRIKNPKVQKSFADLVKSFNDEDI